MEGVKLRGDVTKLGAGSAARLPEEKISALDCLHGSPVSCKTLELTWKAPAQYSLRRSHLDSLLCTSSLGTVSCQNPFSSKATEQVLEGLVVWGGKF